MSLPPMVTMPRQETIACLAKAFTGEDVPVHVVHAVLTDLLSQASDYHQLRAALRALEAELRADQWHTQPSLTWANKIATLLKEHGG